MLRSLFSIGSRFTLRRGRLPASLVVGCAVAIVAGGNSAVATTTSISIDDFTQPDPASLFVLDASNPTRQFSQSAGGAIGGVRNSSFAVIGSATPNSALGMLGHDTSFNIDAFELATNGFSPTVSTLTYGATTPLGVDLNGGGSNNSFLLTFYSSDAQPTTGLDLAITITSPGGGSSTATTIVPNHVPNLPATFDVLVPFSQLSGNASLSDVSSITYVFNGANHTPNIDFELHSLSVVPEPSGQVLIVFAAAAWGCAAFRLHRRRC
jgi:hypothetical protein